MRRVKYVCVVWAEMKNLRGQRLQQVLPELQRHQVGQTTKAGMAHKWRETKNMRGRSWQVKRIKDGGGKEGRGEAGWLVRWRVCSSGLPGVVRDSSICLRTAVARSLLRAHRYSSRTCTLALFMHICKSQWPQVTVFATFKHLGSQSYACELSLKCAQRLLHPLLLAQNKEIWCQRQISVEMCEAPQILKKNKLCKSKYKRYEDSLLCWNIRISFLLLLFRMEWMVEYRQPCIQTGFKLDVIKPCHF